MKNLFVLLLLLICVGSCKKVKDEVVTKDFLQGKWQSQLDPNVLYFAGSNYNIEFEENSFLCEWNYFTDVLEVNDCYPSKNTNFISGKYSLQEFEINLEGNYLDSLYTSLNTDTCRKMGNYNITSEVKRRGDTLIIEMPFFSQTTNTKEKLKFLKE